MVLCGDRTCTRSHSRNSVSPVGAVLPVADAPEIVRRNLPTSHPLGSTARTRPDHCYPIPVRQTGTITSCWEWQRRGWDLLRSLLGWFVNNGIAAQKFGTWQIFIINAGYCRRNETRLIVFSEVLCCQRNIDREDGLQRPFGDVMFWLLSESLVPKRLLS